MTQRPILKTRSVIKISTFVQMQINFMVYCKMPGLIYNLHHFDIINRLSRQHWGQKVERPGDEVQVGGEHGLDEPDDKGHVDENEDGGSSDHDKADEEVEGVFEAVGF